MLTLTNTLTAAQKSFSAHPYVKLTFTSADSATTYTFETSKAPQRILLCEVTDEPYYDHALIHLSNYDKYFKSKDLRGYKVTLLWGFVSAAGKETVEMAPLWVIRQGGMSVEGKMVTTFECTGSWGLLGMHRVMGDTLAISPFWDADTTIAAIQTALIPAALYTITEDDCDPTNICTTYQPWFVTEPNDSLADLHMELMSMTKCGLRFRSDGLHRFYLDSAPASYDYTYDYDRDHVFWSDIKGDALVLPNKIIFASGMPSGDKLPDYSGTATDSGSSTAFRTVTYLYADDTVASDADAATRATASLYRHQRENYAGRIRAPMNVGQEIYDYIQVTDNRAGITITGRVNRIVRRFKPGEYSIDVTVGGFTTETQRVQQRQQVSKQWTVIFDGSTDTPTSLDWAYEAPQPWSETGSVYFSPIMANVIYAIESGGTNFWKYNLSTGVWTQLADAPDSLSESSTITGYRTLVPDDVSTPTTLACIGLRNAGGNGGRRINIYTISSDSWASKAQTPDFTTGTPADGKAQLDGSLVYADSDTIWAWANKLSSSVRKCLKFTISTNTWTVYAGTVTEAQPVRCAAINSGGTIIYGGGATTGNDEHVKYTIAGDTYATSSDGNAIGYTYAYDADKLWYYDDSTYRYGYLDTTDDSYNNNQFPNNADGQSSRVAQCGFADDASNVLAYVSATAPEYMSGPSTAKWQLVTSRFNLNASVIVDKPNDGTLVTMTESGQSRFVLADTYRSFEVPPGEWVFTIPKTGSYTNIKILQGWDKSNRPSLTWSLDGSEIRRG